MKFRYKISFIFFTFLINAFCYNNGYAQLTFDNGLTAQEMAQMLAGPGITVTNATMNCPSNAAGSFSGSSNIGMASGIILTSGSTSVAAGPNNSGSAGTNNSASGDPQLNALAGATTYDACALEFDIVPMCDTLSFNYVFGSEEYPEYVNSGYNDAFAFFISGPGISGQQNIALIPNTSIPVTIDNVNSSIFPQYYINNNGGATIQYDAFTTVLTAWIVVQPCQTYHLKLVIADAGDGIYDSGVFLEEGSMQCISVNTTATVNNSIEGCQNGLFTFCRPQADPTPLTINYTIEGTAINGTDYSSIPNSITIPAGQTCITLDIIPISDGIPEGTETVMIIYQPGPCPDGDTATINITDDFFVTVTPSSSSICQGDNVTLTASGATGYTWSPATGLNTTTGSTVIASPAVTTTYTITGSDGSCTDTATITVTVGISIALSTSQTNITCNGACDGTATAIVSGGVTPYTYQWNDGNSQTTQTATGLCTNTYSVTVTEALGCIGIVNVTISEPPPLALNFASFDATCFGGCDGYASVIPGGGTLPYNYQWVPGPGGGQGSPNAFGICAGTYSLIVTDDNLCIATIASFVIDEPPDFTISTSSTAAHCGQPDGDAAVTAGGATPGYSYLWDANAGNQTTPVATGLALGIYYVTVTDNLGCDTVVSVIVADIPAPVASAVSTPTTCNGDCDGTATGNATGGIKPYLFQWDDNNNQTDSFATALCAGLYSVIVTDAFNCQDTIQVDVLEPTPVVVSPFGDTICIGQCTTIDGNASGGNGAPYAYFWSDTTTNQFNTVCPAISTTYSVYASDVNNCTSPPQNVTVYVHPPLTTIASIDQTVCENAPVNISATASGGNGGPYTYSWDNGAGPGQNVTVTAPAYPDSMMYTVTVSDNCGTPTATDVTTISVYSQPSAYFVNTTVCLNDITEFTDSSTIPPGGTIVAWIWDFGNGDTTSYQNPVNLYGADGTYNVTLVVTSDNGCLGTVVQQVVVYPNPIADFEFEPGTTSILNPMINFINTSSGADSSWWDFGDGTEYVGLDTTHAYADTGTYAVWLIVTDNLGCLDTIVQYVTIEGDFILFAPSAFSPNEDDINEYFIPKGIGIDVNNFEMYIYDRWGDEIFKTTDFFQGWNGRVNNGMNIAQQDVYIWVVYTKDIMDKNHRYVGHVTLIR